MFSNTCPSINPSVAEFIDKKIDDGLPFLGNFLVTGNAGSDASVGATGSASCVANDVTPPSYNVSNNNRDCGAITKLPF